MVVLLLQARQVPVSSPSPPSLPPRSTTTRMLLSAAIYPMAAWASFRLLAMPGSTAIIWPGAGLLLGCLLLLPARTWLPTVAAAWAAIGALQAFATRSRSTRSKFVDRFEIFCLVPPWVGSRAVFACPHR